jgi:hypothetical protein
MAEPFHVRFNIDVPIAEAQRRFVNRIENNVRQAIETVWSDSGNTGSALTLLLAEVQSTLGEPHRETLVFRSEFMKEWAKVVTGDFLRCLTALEGFHIALRPKWGYIANDLNLAVLKTITQSEVDLGINWQNGIFTKKGAELLDEKLVNELLRWLCDAKYENVLIPFQKGLSHFLEGTKDPQRFGDAVTDMYEALEAMAKIVTGKPTKDLSALREDFIAKLRIPETHKAMLKQYIDYGCDFRHALETSQKRAWPLEHEAENFVYMTGLFIRLAIQSEKL